MNRVIVIFILAVLAGCASTQMYTPDGFLTEYGVQQTYAESNQVISSCSQYDSIESDLYVCLRDLVPLRYRFTQAYADLYETYLDLAGKVALGYEAGEITEATSRKTLDELVAEMKYQDRLLLEQYDKAVLTRNARAIAAERQRKANAFSQLGSELLKQSSTSQSSSKTITCRETVPGTVTCDEW